MFVNLVGWTETCIRVALNVNSCVEQHRMCMSVLAVDCYCGTIINSNVSPLIAQHNIISVDKITL